MPAPLWYAGELFGDTYLPFKAAAVVNNIPKWKYAIYVSFCIFALGKIAHIVFRFYCLAALEVSPFYWMISSYADIYLIITSIIVDLVCCGAMYQTSKGFRMTKKTVDVMKLIKTSSLLRIACMTFIKLLVGGYWLSTVCLEDYATCPTSYLRGITITVEYQLYYLDYILTKNSSEHSSEKATNVQSSHMQSSNIKSSLA